MEVEFNQQLMAERIKKARGARNMTQEQLAGIVGVDGNAVSNWERGANVPSVQRLDAICRALDVTPDFLLGYAGDLAVA